MLRDLQVTLNKPVNTMYSADSDMKTGMAVVGNHDTKKADFPTAEIGIGLAFVDKERIPTGINTARGNMSDYDPDFINVAEGEMIKMVEFLPGDVFGTDQYVTTGLAVNDMLASNTSGMLKRAAAGVQSIYQYTGTHDDNGYILARVKVLQAPRTN